MMHQSGVTEKNVPTNENFGIMGTKIKTVGGAQIFLKTPQNYFAGFIFIPQNNPNKIY